MWFLFVLALMPRPAHCIVWVDYLVTSVQDSDIEPKTRVLRGSIFDLSAVSTTNIQAHWPARMLVDRLIRLPTLPSPPPAPQTKVLLLVSQETIEMILWVSFTSLRTAFNTYTKNKTLKINFNVFYFIIMWTVKGFLSFSIGIQLLCNNIFEIVVSNIFRHQ